MSDVEQTSRRLPVAWWRMIGPGILVAATGVGTGDLATGALVGSTLGVAVLWAVVLGAGLKFVLNEGLARWQLATGSTVLEGIVRNYGRVAQGVFLVYLLMWTYFTAVALMSACGIAMHAMLPLGEAAQDKVIYGLAHSLLAVVLVEAGGYKLFERVMSVCVGLMFVTVVVTAVAVAPEWGDVLSGLTVPRIPDLENGGLRWTVALIGGVGGTLTVLCYGYWIREEGRTSPEDLRACRVDLAAGYSMTALFGIAMVIIGSRISVEGKSAELLVRLSTVLAEELGTGLRWLFLIGAWGAIFSSLLGVWQSVPYLFADFLRLSNRSSDTAERIDTKSLPYRAYLYGMATLPALGLFRSFATVQKAYAVFGALFIPLLAVALLLLNGSTARVGEAHRNRWLSTVGLLLAIGLFIVYGYFEILQSLSG
ncbi:MAG: Nramp family divalent metal transporter [Planctomycetaceae bacterium]|nr:Nramp family divalent metal transporter [Planctomycetaceae bacterium]